MDRLRDEGWRVVKVGFPTLIAESGDQVVAGAGRWRTLSA